MATASSRGRCGAGDVALVASSACGQRGVGVDAIEFEAERRVLPVRRAQVLDRGSRACCCASRRCARSSSASARTSALADSSGSRQLRFGAAQVAERRAAPPRSARACARRCVGWRRSAPTCADIRAQPRARRAPTRALAGDAQRARRARRVRDAFLLDDRGAQRFERALRRRPCGNTVRPARPARRRARLPRRSPCKSSSASVCSASARSKSPSAIRHEAVVAEQRGVLVRLRSVHR